MNILVQSSNMNFGIGQDDNKLYALCKHCDGRLKACPDPIVYVCVSCNHSYGAIPLTRYPKAVVVVDDAVVSIDIELRERLDPTVLNWWVAEWLQVADIGSVLVGVSDL